MTAKQRKRLKALGASVDTAMEGENWRTLYIAGEGFGVYLREDDTEGIEALLVQHEPQG